MQYTIVYGRENKRIDIEMRCRMYKKNVGFDKIKMSETYIFLYLFTLFPSRIQIRSIFLRRTILELPKHLRKIRTVIESTAIRNLRNRIIGID